MPSHARGANTVLSTLAAVLVLCGAASAQDAAEFYRGKTVNLVVGFNPGGGADTYARLVARHLGRHVAGNPTVVVRNMQGAGSVIAANYVFNVSPKDGLELGLFAGNIVIDPLIGGTQQKYEARDFNWIGNISSSAKISVSAPISPRRNSWTATATTSSASISAPAPTSSNTTPSSPSLRSPTTTTSPTNVPVPSKNSRPTRPVSMS